ncbi:unnamed protein product [Linum trigynum]|uniref:Uncharacterized protein n=1 Tax=Linum trigynum TaxID=586398 RepID=A0AAV2E030_9ROSI
MRRSRANFVVAINESQPRSSSRSNNVVAVIQLGKVFDSPSLIPHEVRTLSPPIRDRDLGLLEKFTYSNQFNPTLYSQDITNVAIPVGNYYVLNN